MAKETEIAALTVLIKNAIYVYGNNPGWIASYLHSQGVRYTRKTPVKQVAKGGYMSSAR